MSWDDYTSTSWRDKVLRRAPLIGGGIAAAVAVVIIAFVLVKTVGDVTDGQNASSGAVDENDVPTATVNTAPPGLPGPPDVEDDQIEDYSDTPMPASEFTKVYPRAESGLDDATYDRAIEYGRGLVTADVTLQGRNNYPTYFPYAPPPTALASPFVLDFVAPTAVAGQPQLVRIVGIWHGTSFAGDQLLQVRRSYYAIAKPLGTFEAIRADDLPENVRKSDPMLAGISITG